VVEKKTDDIKKEIEISEVDALRLRNVCEKHLSRTPRSIENLPAGLGTRRFYRIEFETGAPSRLIARLEADPADAQRVRHAKPEPEPPQWLPEPALEPVRTFLEEAGLPVPKSAFHDAVAGLDLIEDLGDQTLLDVASPERRERYLEACDLITRLQSLHAEPNEIPAFARVYDRALLDTKSWKWLHWTLPLLLGRPATEEEIAQTTALFDHIHGITDAAPLALSHRDFKAENLHLSVSSAASPPSPGASFSSGTPRPEPRLVMIDVQGAFLAPPEYDLVCLLCDMQVELGPEEIAALAEHTRTRLPSAPDRAIFEERFDALMLARVCKDVSHVIHAGLRRGDGRRWKELPRAFSLISAVAERRGSTFPGARALTSVIQALTVAVESADSPHQGPGESAGKSVRKSDESRSDTERRESEER
jgi:aminoglycoside/choline kinase family phosphotransferase